jgi:hypothetical protein
MLALTKLAAPDCLESASSLLLSVCRRLADFFVFALRTPGLPAARLNSPLFSTELAFNPSTGQLHAGTAKYGECIHISSTSQVFPPCVLTTLTSANEYYV